MERLEKKLERLKVETKKKFTQSDFIYDKETESYLCPAGKVLEYKCDVTLRNNSGKQYRAKSVDCANCSLKDKCIRNRGGKNSARTLYVIDKKYEENLSEKMREKIDDPAYRELYSRRMQIIEPVFSNITHCKGMDRFTLRTKEKVNTQWQLYCIVHNIGKCMNALAAKMGFRGN